MGNERHRRQDAGNVYCAVTGHADLESERDQLRAHVAALVEAGRSVVALHSSPEVTALSALLDAPDLAALVKREQAREGIETAIRDLIRAGESLPVSIVLALRALDAARLNTEGDLK